MEKVNEENNILDVIRHVLPSDVAIIEVNVTNNNVQSIPILGALHAALSIGGHPTTTIHLQRRIPIIKVRETMLKEDATDILNKMIYSEMPKCLMNRILKHSVHPDINAEYYVVDFYFQVGDLMLFMEVLEKEAWDRYSNVFDDELVLTLTSG